MISTVLCGRFYKIFVSPMLHEKRHRRRDAFFRRASDFVLTEGAAPPQTPPSRPSASEVKHASLTPAALRQPPRGRLEEDLQTSSQSRCKNSP